MKYYPNNFEQIVLKIKQKQLGVILLYGPDKGMASEFISKLARGFNARISHAESLELLLSFLRNTNMFAQKEIIKIDADLKLNDTIKKILETPSNNIIVITGGELSPSSSIRKFFEANSNLASIACYPDEAGGITRIISQKLTSANRQIEKAALNFLASNLGGDRLVILSEIDKLLLYTEGVLKISLQDVEQSISKSENTNPDELCIAFAAKLSDIYLKEQDKLLAESISEIWIIRSLSRYYMNLLKVRLLIQDGVSIDTAVKELKPPIFFKYAGAFNNNVRNNTLAEISSILELLLEAEIDAKRGMGSLALERIFIKRFLE